MIKFFDTFQLYFLKAFQVVKLDSVVMKELAKDQNARGYAFWIMILPLILDFLLLSLGYRVFPVQQFLFLFIFLVMDVLMLFAMSFVARKFFHGSAFHWGFFSVAALGTVLKWVLILAFVLSILGLPISGLIGILSFVVAVWTLIVFYNVLKVVHSLSSLHAVLCLLIVLLADSFVKHNLLEMFFGENYLDVLLKFSV